MLMDPAGVNINPRSKTMSKKGQFAVTGSVVAVLVVAIMVIVGALTYGYVRDAITTPMSNLASTSFNNTVANVDSNAYAGFDLLSVAAIVLAAVAIVSIVLLLKAVA
jgi:hypothetical protein